MSSNFKQPLILIKISLGKSTNFGHDSSNWGVGVNSLCRFAADAIAKMNPNSNQYEFFNQASYTFKSSEFISDFVFDTNCYDCDDYLCYAVILAISITTIHAT